MADASPGSQPPPDVSLVPGRACGACNACCSYYPIPALDKPPRVLCGNWQAGTGCRIYETRPDACRTFFCLWRRNASFDDGWRPDRSGFVLRETTGDIPAHYLLRNGIVFELVGPDSAIEAEAFIQAVANLVLQRVPIFLSAHAPSLTRTNTVFLNDRLAPAIASRLRDAIVEALHEALAQLKVG